MTIKAIPATNASSPCPDPGLTGPFFDAAGLPNPVSRATPNPLVTVTLSTFPGLCYSFQTDATLQNFQEFPRSAFTATDYTTSLEILLGSGRDFVRGKRE